MPAAVPRSLVRWAANPAGWARRELAVPQLQPCWVAFAPLILLCCLGNDGIQHRSDLTERQTSCRDMGERGGVVRALALGSWHLRGGLAQDQAIRQGQTWVPPAPTPVPPPSERWP